MSPSHEERIFLGASCRAIGLGHSGQHYTNDSLLWFFLIFMFWFSLITITKILFCTKYLQISNCWKEGDKNGWVDEDHVRHLDQSV